VTFSHSFLLPGMDRPQQAGTYQMQVEEVPLDLSFEAYQVRMTLFLTSPGSMSALHVTHADLELALAADQQRTAKMDPL
jgi:hypothetical protein